MQVLAYAPLLPRSSLSQLEHLVYTLCSSTAAVEETWSVHAADECFFFFCVETGNSICPISAQGISIFSQSQGEQFRCTHQTGTHTPTNIRTHTHTSSKRTTRNMPDRDVTLERDNSSWCSKIEAVQQYSFPSDVNWKEMATEIEREWPRASER